VGIQVLLWCLALPNGFIMTRLPRLRLAMTIWNNSPPMAGCPSGRVDTKSPNVIPNEASAKCGNPGFIVVFGFAKRLYYDWIATAAPRNDNLE